MPFACCKLNTLVETWGSAKETGDPNTGLRSFCLVLDHWQIREEPAYRIPLLKPRPLLIPLPRLVVALGESEDLRCLILLKTELEAPALEVISKRS
jgi:hypothetical protein